MEKNIKLFLDCEFTGLIKDASLISLALYKDDHSYFYAEFNDYDKSKLSEWHIENVISKLEFENTVTHSGENGDIIKIKNSTAKIVNHLKKWLAEFNAIEIWADVPHYDWVLFCDLFGGALSLPKNIHYICRDIATLLLARGVDIDIIRVEFVKDKLMDIEQKQHHALFDAMIGELCFEKLIII